MKIESKFRKEFQEVLSKFGFRIHPIENKIVIGMPDLLVIFPGYSPLWVELKTNSVLGSNQMLWIKRHPEERVLLASCKGTRQYLHFKLTVSRGDEWVEIYTDFWPLQSEGNFIEIMLEQMPK